MSAIPKKIHLTWKTKDLLSINSVFLDHSVKNLVALADGWGVEVSDDTDVDDYLKKHLNQHEYLLIKDDHPVSKTDFWRLLKLFNEGGLYCDIDRLCNISINTVLNPEIKMLLPSCLDYDFSQDFMCSAANNPIFANTLAIALSKRSSGISSIYALGPQSYMEGVSYTLLGYSISQKPDKETFDKIRIILDKTPFIYTYKEHPPYNNILYRANVKPFDHEIEKRKFYAQNGVKHWTGEW